MKNYIVHIIYEHGEVESVPLYGTILSCIQAALAIYPEKKILSLTIEQDG